MENHKLFKVNQNAVLQDSDGDVLILKKDGKWMLVGGRMNENESWQEGLEREVREETGIESFSIQKIMNVDMSDSGETYIVTFLCRVEGNPKVKLSDEHQEYAWLKAVDVDNYDFWHDKIKERLKLIFQNQTA